MSIIMGLGNPGPDYAGNRHNIGFWSVAQLAKRLGVRLRRQGQAMSAEGMLAGYPVVLATPRTFMNRSGRAARELLELHRKKPEDLVVLHDEVDLVLGKIRIKQAGGHGGHNGLRSIIEVTGTREFLRIRLGVGRPEDRDDDLADWVLSDFAKGEGSTARELAERGADAVETVLTAGVEEAMNHYHVPSSEGRARNDS
jgi:PTH1 family peptidyl-tRNA hydrolase